MGGADRLPRAFATTLAGRIRYQAPVVRIEPGESSAAVVIGRDGQHQKLTADHIVCTIPFSVLKSIDVSPSFSPQKAGPSTSCRTLRAPVSTAVQGERRGPANVPTSRRPPTFR